MSTDAITRPSISHRSPRTVLQAALALIAAAGIGAGVVALASSGTSDTHVANTRPAPLATEGTGNTCAGDGGALLATVAAMPVDVSNNIVSRLSPQTRAMLTSAAEESALTNSPVETPDTATLAGVLARVGPADAAAVMSGLSPQTRTAIGAGTTGAACA